MPEMTPTRIEKIEKKDIKAPQLDTGGTAIVFERHQKYQRDLTADNAGSVLPEVVDSARDRDEEFFRNLLEEGDDETMILFVGSPTQYGGDNGDGSGRGGRRSIETAQIAQEAAVNVMQSLGMDPSERIVNLNQSFNNRSVDDGIAIRPTPLIREPDLFQNPVYLGHLQEKYGSASTETVGNEMRKTGLSIDAFVAHESDKEKDARYDYGTDGKPVEGVPEIVERTNKQLAILERYAQMFHRKNPGRKLVIWASSHYDTISPFVKDSIGLDPIDENHIPVDYGAGIVIEIPPNNIDKSEASFEAQGQRVSVSLGKSVTKRAATVK